MTAGIRRWKRRIAVAAALLLVGVLGGLVGSMVTPARFTLGPHRADLRVIAEPVERFDLGPLGSFSKPYGRLGFGVEVTVREIPARHGAAASPSLEEYVRLYSDYDQVRDDATSALARHAAAWGIGTAIVVALVAAALWALLGGARRTELARAMRPRRRAFAVGVLAVSVVTATMYVVRATTLDDPRPNVSAVFDDTPLEGAHVDGALLALLVNEYGGRVGTFVNDTNQFYEALTARVDEQFAAATPLTPGPDTRTVLFTVGLHCNVGMARPIGRVAELWDPTLVVSGGDDALGSTGLERACMSGIAYRLRKHPVVVAPGDHDSRAGIDEMRRSGFTVLDGETVSKEGLRILGDDDPRVAVFGSGLVPRRGETVREMGARLAKRACEDPDGVDILVANEPNAIRDTARRGCARLVLAGAATSRASRVVAPDGRVVARYLGASAGGAAGGTLTVGRLHAPASVVIVELDARTHAPRRYQEIDFFPEGLVTIGASVGFASAPLDD